jgi:Arc/MetJ-type ribon-helix-helix transcriptional regulator
MANIGVRKGRRIKLSISISEKNAAWIEDQVVAERYRSISDAIDSLIREKKISEGVI